MIKTTTTRPRMVINNDNYSNNNNNNRQTSMVDEHECTPWETSCSTSAVHNKKKRELSVGMHAE